MNENKGRQHRICEQDEIPTARPSFTTFIILYYRIDLQQIEFEQNQH